LFLFETALELTLEPEASVLFVTSLCPPQLFDPAFRLRLNQIHSYRNRPERYRDDIMVRIPINIRLSIMIGIDELVDETIPIAIGGNYCL